MAIKYLTTGEVAKILGISRIAVFKNIVSGKIAAIRAGRNYLIDPKELGLSYGKLDKKKKRKIKGMVDKVFKEYGDVIKKLGSE